jgi:4-diphosphocytidyl-2-C-methyl-D-erythritol kinase
VRERKMERINIECPAKINLSLDVLGKRNDGYHELRMIMQSIDLYDEIILEKTSDGISICCDNKAVPTDQTNICYKVAVKLFEKYSIKGGINIKIIKRIPIAAGLAGGSADAAGVIEGINKLYELGMTTEEMFEAGLSVGADVPFCLLKGTALAEGIGEVLTPLKTLKAWCVIAKPNIAVSTASVFQEYREEEVKHHPDTELLIKLVKEGDLPVLAENMINVLESVTIKKYEIIDQIKNIMLQYGALGSLMSGSGPTVFGIFDSKATAEKCYHRLSDYLKEVYLTKTI